MPANQESERIIGAKQQVLITRVFDAPREMVFAAWTDPKHVAQWWGPYGFTVPFCQLDVRPGGVMHIHMRAPDGSVIPSEGVYQEIVAPERLVFTTRAFEDEYGSPQLEVLHTITFADLGGKTKLTLQAQVVKATPEVSAALDGMKQGWIEALERLNESIQGSG